LPVEFDQRSIHRCLIGGVHASQADRDLVVHGRYCAADVPTVEGGTAVAAIDRFATSG
jgi:hypothetical protein